ncbi:hypothetical protein [Methylobacterium sp. AMS5]|uniref:hypothetical protein n=1 Tax=Methylobacterium sp. AMS5 TaxID=925818 RepID=UPI00074FA253|nr:hypothetical protein [Methylobacterium sp. AMS5]AMB45066.1 hypothetical protein Y590_09163 [Methylobacterium sp. AMS5]
MSGPEIVRRTLAKYREQPAVGLEFTFPVSWQMDEEACQVIAAELKSHGTKWECRRAVPDLYQSLPSKTGIYMFSFHSKLCLSLASDDKFAPSWVLYVGRAGSRTSERTLKERYRSEYTKYVGGDLEELWSDVAPKGRPQLLRRYLCVYPLEYWYCTIEDRTKIEYLEEKLIRYLSPPLNTIGRPRVRLLPPNPAFRSY